MNSIKIKKSIFILIFIVSIGLSSCDPATSCAIINKNEMPIGLKIYYNQDSDQIKHYIKEKKGFAKFIKYNVKNYNPNYPNKIYIDSIRSYAGLKINENDTLYIWGGMGITKEFSDIKKIEIIFTDKKKIEIDGSKINKIFEEKQGGLYVYEAN